MANTWGPAVVLSDEANFSMSRRLAQLSDGTEVLVIGDPTEANLKLYYLTDRSTLNLIATIPMSALPSMATVTICVDGFDNIYLQYVPQTQAVTVKAFVKGAGYTWTAKTAIATTSASAAATGSANCLLWCNTGGGTGGAGHLLSIFRDASSAGVTIGTLDAGVALAGSGTIIVSAYSNGAFGNSAPWDASADGFGALQGVLVFRVTANPPGIGAWQVSSSGLLTVAVIVSGITPGFSSTTAAQVRVVSYGPGSQQWDVFAQSSTTSEIAVAQFSNTAQLNPTAPATPAGGDWPTGPFGAANEWDAFADPNAPGRAYVLTWGAAVNGSTRLLGVTNNVTGPVWDAVDTLEDTSVGAPVSPTYYANIRCTNEPRGPVTDYIAMYSPNSGTSWAVVGDFAQPTGSDNAPTIESPDNGAYLDVSAGVPVDWDYNNADGANQTAFALRYKVAGAAGYQYWNVAAGVSSSTIVWNPSSSTSYTLPAGAMLNGRPYNWSIATQSSTMIQSSFAGDNLLNATALPTVTITGPAATVTTTSYPTVTWTTTLGAGAKAQTSYRIIVYTLAQTSVGGFGFGLGFPSTWDSGVVPGSANSVMIPTALANGEYFVYVIVTQTGGQSSLGNDISFIVNTLNPAQPVLNAVPSFDPVTGAPRISLAVQGEDNMMSANDSSFETSVAGYTGTNAALAQSATQALSGTKSMRMTASSAATMSAKCTNVSPVLPNTKYSAVASLRAGTTGRTVTVSIAWQDASHNPISTVAGASINDLNTAFNQATCTAISPANAAYAYVIVTAVNPANGEIHYVDCVGIFLGANTTWTINFGNATTYAANIFYSDDLDNWFPVRDGQWIPDPAGAGAIATVYDYESIPNVNRYYYAQIVQGGVGGFTSPASPVVYAATEPGTRWWLKDPIDSTVALGFNQGPAGQNSDGSGPPNISTQIIEKTTAHTLLGRQFDVMVSDGMQGENGSAVVVTNDEADWLTLVELITRPARTLLLQSPFGRQWYVNLLSPRGIDLPAWLLGHPMRNTTLVYAEADTP